MKFSNDVIQSWQEKLLNRALLIFICCAVVSCESKVVAEKNFKFDDLSIHAVSSIHWGDSAPTDTKLNIKSHGITLSDDYYKKQLGIEIYYPRGSFVYFPNKKQIILDLFQGTKEGGHVFAYVNTVGSPVITPIFGSLLYPTPIGRVVFPKNQNLLQNNNNQASCSMGRGVYYKDLNISYHSCDGATLIIDYEKELLYPLSPVARLNAKKIESKQSIISNDEDYSYDKNFSPPLIIGFTDDRSYLWTAQILVNKNLIYTCLEKIQDSSIECKLIHAPNSSDTLQSMAFIERSSNDVPVADYGNEHWINGKFSSFEVVNTEEPMSPGEGLLAIIEKNIHLEKVGTEWHLKSNR